MKCPKCGFNSFEYLDNCRKCNNDLIGFKQSLGIQPVILPSLQKSQVLASEVADDTSFGIEEPATGDFSWEGESADIGTSPATETARPGSVSAVEPAPTEGFSFGESEPAKSPGAVPTGTFGEFSFDETAAEPAPPATTETQTSWGGSSDFGDLDFPGFDEETTQTGTEVKPAASQAPTTEGAFNTGDFADLFKDDGKKS